MSGKRLRNRKKIEDIANERIDILTGLSVRALMSGRPDRAVRYVDLSLRICGKTKVSMPEGFAFCNEKCNSALFDSIGCARTFEEAICHLVSRLIGGKSFAGYCFNQ